MNQTNNFIQSEIDDGEINFYTSREPTEPYDILENAKTLQPIGALFTRAGE